MGRLINTILEFILDLFASVIDFCVSGSPLHQTIATVVLMVFFAFVAVIFHKK